jgi:hypothetical protein
MKTSAVIALYVLVLTNTIGLGLLCKSVSERFSNDDYSKYILVKEHKVVSFNNHPYLKLKVLNTSKRPLDQIEWSVSFYDTNNVHVVTIESYSRNSLQPNKETTVCIDMQYEIEEYELKKNKYRFEVSPNAARVAF